MVARLAAERVGPEGDVTGLAVGDFILRHLAAIPVAHTVEALSDTARKALSEDAAMALRPYADGDGIAFPETANVLTGIR